MKNQSPSFTGHVSDGIILQIAAVI